MHDLEQQMNDGSHRRGFFHRIAALSALGLFGLATPAQAQPAPSEGPNWP